MGLRQGLLAAALIGIATPALAGQDHILVGIDDTAFFEATAQVFHKPGQDAVLVLDASDAAHPRIAASLPLTNSVLGPPTNLQITPDGRLGLVASSVTVADKAGTWTATPDNRLWVIDLAASPPVLVDTVTVGRQPSGLAISRDGTMALIANRAGKSVSVLSIAGGKVTQTAEVPVGDEVVAVAISPDGRRGFVAKNAAGKIGVLGIDGGRVTYDKAQDMPAGFNPYNLDATADGALVLAANNGIAGNAATLTVIDARATPPRVIDTVTVGDSPEGFAIAPDGRSGVSVLLRGSSLPHAAWAYRRNGSVAAFGIDGRRVTPKGAEVEIGALPEGVAYSRDGSHVYVADYVDRVLHVLRVTADGVADTGTKLDLPGQPASMRGIAH